MGELAAWLRPRLAEIEARLGPAARQATLARVAAINAERERLFQQWWDGLKRPPAERRAGTPRGVAYCIRSVPTR